MESHRKTLCNSCWNWTTDLDWIKVVTFSWTGSDVCHFCCFIIRCVFVSLAAAVDGLFWFHFYFTSRNFALGGDNDYPTDRRRWREGGGSRRRNEPVLFFFFLFPQAEGCGHCWWLRRFELFVFFFSSEMEKTCFASSRVWAIGPYAWTDIIFQKKFQWVSECAWRRTSAVFARFVWVSRIAPF